MKTLHVVDVGNTRLKWARCDGARVGAVTAWTHEPTTWSPIGVPARWVVAGVVPAVVDAFAEWARGQVGEVTVIDSLRQVPIETAVGEPGTVGIDRLLGALAAGRRWPGESLLIVDAGTAITLNVVDARGVFRGGAILPGVGLMARSLHQFTARLPLVEAPAGIDFPAGDTRTAIGSGIGLAASGAVERAARLAGVHRVIFTGGDGELLHRLVDWPAKEWAPALTLDGIRIAAESLP